MTPSVTYLAIKSDAHGSDLVRIANSTMRSHYDGADLRAHVRPGALDAFHLPSLHGGRRVYPKRQPHGGMA